MNQENWHKTNPGISIASSSHLLCLIAWPELRLDGAKKTSGNPWKLDHFVQKRSNIWRLADCSVSFPGCDDESSRARSLKDGVSWKWWCKVWETMIISFQRMIAVDKSMPSIKTIILYKQHMDMQIIYDHLQMIFWLVVWNIFYFCIYWE